MTPRVACATALLLALAAPVAHAAPAVRVLAFQDVDPTADCPPWAARTGDCIEEVRLLAAADVTGPGRDDPAARALAIGVARTTFRLWDDLAWRWETPGSRVAATVGASAGSALPTPAAEWDSVAWGGGEGPAGQLGLPAAAGWIAAADLFAPVRVAEPPGVPAAPPLTLLRGRFAGRLGYDGRAWPFDVMDADGSTSGPFFEQLFPYRRGDLPRPLASFDLPEHLAGLGPNDRAPVADAVGANLLTPEEDTAAGVHARAHRAFDAFARLSGVQLAQFAMEDYTPNHVRILAALTAMRLPPGVLTARGGPSRDLVAAALGETDAPGAAPATATSLALPGGFPLHLDQLPAPIAWEHLARLAATTPFLRSPAFVAEVDGGARDRLGERVRADAGRLGEVSEAAVRAWIAAAARPGADRQPLEDEVARIALAVALDALEPAAREETETWLLLDHVALAVAGGLDPTPGSRRPPADVAAAAEAAWRSVLTRHGRPPRPIDQRLGGVDPTAICTTRDGADALAEPSFGAVGVELLVDARDGATDAEAVLWERRDDVPLFAIDDPSTTRPTLVRLVGLPGGRALYRVRWAVWTGWHVLWDTQALVTGQRRLVARTAAVCDDLVLAPPALVPTLIRAGVLEGDLLPAVPARASDRPPPDRRAEPVDNDAALAAARSSSAQATGGAAAGQEAAAAVAAAPTPDTVAGLAGAAAPDAAAESLEQGPVSEAAAWLQALVRAPLERGHTPESDALLVILDATAPERGLPGAQARVTPYFRTRVAAGPGGAVQVAGHVRHLDGPEGRDAPLLAPSWRATESVRAEAERPRWRPTTVVDYDLAAGLGLFPWRETWSSCETRAGDLGTVAPCPDTELRTRADGLSVDLSGGTTIWPGLRPRAGLDAGLVALLDVVPAGSPVLWPHAEGAPADGGVADGTPTYTWTLRPQGGLYTGLRLLLAPARLWGPGKRVTWGAEAADGSARLARTEVWLRGGFTAGPGYNGLEGTAYGELGLGRSAVPTRGRAAPLAPYHPTALVSALVRYQYGFTLLEGEEPRLLSLERSHAVVVGVRARFRLSAAGPAPKELAP